MNFSRATLAALLAFAVVHAYAAAAVAQESPAAVWPTKVWEFSTPEEQGMDSRALALVVDNARAEKQDSPLIIRHGRIVVDAYCVPFTAGIRHELRSVTKSFVGTLLGIAVQQRLLENLDRPVLDFFPDKTVANVDDRKKAMTVQSLLDMTSGLEWKWTAGQAGG